MKKNALLLLVCAIVLTVFVKCKKTETVTVVKVYGCTDPTSSNYNPSATDDDGTCKYVGKALFWFNADGAGGTTTVIVNGLAGYITKYYPTYNPDCGSDGCATFTLPVGTYSFQAASSKYTWTGNVTVTKNGCSKHLLLVN